MANPWFKMHANFAFNARVQMMSEVLQRRLLLLMCLRCADFLDDATDDEIAFQLRIDLFAATATKTEFIARGFIDGNWQLLEWENEQRRVDQKNSTVRVREHRRRKRDGALHETPSETHQGTLVALDETHDETTTETPVNVAEPAETPVKTPIARDETADETQGNALEEKREEQKRTDQKKETFPEAPVGDGVIAQIVLAHPHAKARGLHETTVTRFQSEAVIRAIQNLPITAERLLSRVKLIAERVEQWPISDRRYLSKIERFFDDYEFNQPLEAWEHGSSQRDRKQPGRFERASEELRKANAVGQGGPVEESAEPIWAEPWRGHGCRPAGVVLEGTFGAPRRYGHAAGSDSAFASQA